MKKTKWITAVLTLVMMCSMSVMANATEITPPETDTNTSAMELVEQMIADLESELAEETVEDTTLVSDEEAEPEEAEKKGTGSKSVQRQERLANKELRIERARETQIEKQAARDEKVAEARETQSEKQAARDEKVAEARETQSEKQAARDERTRQAEKTRDEKLAERDARIARAYQTRLDRQAARDAKIAMLEDLKALRGQIDQDSSTAQESVLDELVLMQEELQILSSEA